MARANFRLQGTENVPSHTMSTRWWLGPGGVLHHCSFLSRTPTCVSMDATCSSCTVPRPAPPARPPGSHRPVRVSSLPS
eukprot:6254226-Prymnesium_polylepis.1